MSNLTKNQIKRLRQIRDYRPDSTTLALPYPAFWKGWNTDRSLVARGLIERVNTERGVMTLFCCRLTDLGRAALAEKGEAS